MHRTVPALCVCLAASAAAAQGSTLPGAHPTSIETQRGQYSSALRVQVDTLLENLRRDLEKRNAGWVADDYAKSASIVLDDGTSIPRRDEIKNYYARILERATAAKLTVQEIDGQRDGFHVDAQIVLTRSVPGGKPYELIVPVKLQLAPGNQGDMAIVAQKGGDVALVSAVNGDLVRRVGVGTGDSLHVRVTNAAGITVAGVAVIFNVASGQGTISPAAVKTDGLGIAATYFVAGTLADSVSRVEAVAAELPNEPVAFRIRATAVAP